MTVGVERFERWLTTRLDKDWNEGWASALQEITRIRKPRGSTSF
jgi:hypothetical protein